MDSYHLTLFVHLLTVIVAAAATAILSIALRRRARARTVAEMLEWHKVVESTAKAFPVSLASFVITGGYMLSLTQTPILSTGFPVAGLVGVAWLLLTGIFLGIKGKALRSRLEEMANQGLEQPAPKLVPPPFIAALPAINATVALAVVFDMTMKPPSIPLALAVLAVGFVGGAALGVRRAAPTAEQVRAS